MADLQNLPKPLSDSGEIATIIRREYLSRQVLIPFTRPELLDSHRSVWRALYVFYPIAEFLSPVEVLNLTSIHRQLINEETNSWIISRFKENLYGLMRASGHSALVKQLTILATPWPFVISGSIVLQALLSVKWDRFDIDIFGKIDGVDLIQSLLVESSYQNFYVRGDTTDRYIILHASQTLKAVKDWYNYQREREEHALPLSTVQVIELTDKIIAPAACVQSFDLNIVKNSWDGRRIRISNWSSLVQRRAKVSTHIERILAVMGNVCGSLANPFKRLYELQNDQILTIDLSVWNLSLSDDIIVSVFSKIFYRFLKYTKRGFTISCGGREWGEHDINVILNRLQRNRTNKQNAKLRSQILRVYDKNY